MLKFVISYVVNTTGEMPADVREAKKEAKSQKSEILKTFKL